MIKKIIAFTVISGALAFAVLLIVGKNYNPHSVKNENPPKLNNANNSISAKNINNAGAENSTAELVKKISEELAANPPGSIEPEKIVEEYLTEGIKKFNYPALKPEIKTSDLKIINNISPQLAENYRRELENILKKNFGNLIIPVNNFTSIDWDSVINAYTQAIIDLYKLAVPQNLAAFHQKEIALVSAQKKVFQYIQNYKNDPLQAYLAINAAQAINNEFYENSF